MNIPQPYLIFLGDVDNALDAKTGFGLVHWRPQLCLAQRRLPGCRVDLGIPDMSPAEARAAGARALVIGVAPFGGAISPTWVEAITAALDAGLDVASGLHTRLASIPAIAEAARRNARSLFDVRSPGRAFDVGSGRKRSGLRLLTVGTDCAVGKKYAALSIVQEMLRRGLQATFRATGQTGILISGSGVAIDAVVADFVAGAAEALSPDNDPRHWDIIEGQGSLFHPAYAGVSLGLLHGSQPDAIVVCHDPRRPHIDGYPSFAVPGLRQCIDANLKAAHLTNPAARCVGVALNTSALDPAARERFLSDTAASLNVPCFDPIATGACGLVAALIASGEPAAACV
ncbi:MAG: DUF1611 domain-containing protein [Gammaproteobacteria bacterium]